MKNRMEGRQQTTETQNWLASILLKHGEQIMGRFAYFYEQLAAMPRQTRRGLQKKLAMPLAGAALMLALSGAPSVHAATITVNPGSAGVNGADGGCSLVEAILTANTGTPASADCSGGTAGADTITLAGNTYSYTSAYAASNNALPAISSEMTIEANGATIERTVGSPDFRIIYNNTGNLTLNNVTITGGYIGSSGGGIFNYSGIVTLNNSTVSGNSAYHGGGISNASTMTLNNSTVSGNSISGGGGGISNDKGGTMTLNNSTVSGNIASGDGFGGGIYNASTMTLNNSTVSNNSAVAFFRPPYGGGVFNGAEATLNLNRSLISGNTAISGGAEIYNKDDSKYGIGTVVANNYNLLGHSGLTEAKAVANISTLGANDIIATSNNTSAATYTPTVLSSILNTALGNYGGSTKINHLVVGSPAIDAAPSAACTAVPINNIDQRGLPRNVDGLGDGVTANECDIGAHEMQSPTAVSLQSISSATSSSAGGIAAAFSMMSLAMGGLWLRLRGRRTA